MRYDANDYFKLSFGRYHTPINYWNTAFHHGQWLQTTISRPEMTQFGGSFIPVHFIGTLVEGAMPAGGLESELQRRDWATGAGRSSAAAAISATSITTARGWSTLSSSPMRLYGLQVGGSVYRDLINPLDGAGGARVDPIGAHRVAEGDAGGDRGVCQCHPPAGQRRAAVEQPGVLCAGGVPAAGLTRSLEAVLPLRADPHPQVGLRSSAVVPSIRRRPRSGVRYDISAFAAFKIEYRYYWPPRSAVRSTACSAQTSFTF